MPARHDLTMRYGPVVRTATVMGVLDAAFDVIVPEFGIEKRVHVDQMPIEKHTYDESRNALSIYWKEMSTSSRGSPRPRTMYTSRSCKRWRSSTR